MRPTKLTASTRLRLLEALRLGAHRSVAARVAGISPDTLGEWMERGRERAPGESPPRRPASPTYAQFAREVLEAEAAAEVGAIHDLHDQMKKDHRAALAFLERRFGDRWRVDAAPMPGPHEAPIHVERAERPAVVIDQATLKTITDWLLERKRIERGESPSSGDSLRDFIVDDLGRVGVDD